METNQENVASTETAADQSATQENQENVGTQDTGSTEANQPTGEAGVDASEANKFTPNFKYKADKQEMEIPERFRSLMTDSASEKEVRELFEKSYGLEKSKAKLQEAFTERDHFAQENSQYQNYISQAKKSFQEYQESGNPLKLDTMWKQLGIPEEAIMQFAYAKAKLAEMDPAQRDAVQRQLELERKTASYADREAELQNQYQQQDLKIRQMEFNHAMSNAQIQNLSTEFNSKFGLDFAEQVIEAGKMAFALEGKTLTVSEAINSVVSRFKLGQNPTSLPAGQQVPQQAGNAQQPKVIKRETKSLPNVGGSGNASPLKTTKVKSIDDLKALHARALAGEQI